MGYTHCIRPADTVAAAVLLELHVAIDVTFCITPEPYVAIAASCSVPAIGISPGFKGVKAMNRITGAWQVSVADPVTPPLVAEIVTVPPLGHNHHWEMHDTTPVADTVATLVSLELQAAVLVRFCVGPEE